MRGRARHVAWGLVASRFFVAFCFNIDGATLPCCGTACCTAGDLFFILFFLIFFIFSTGYPHGGCGHGISQKWLCRAVCPKN
jgi:hypothetical protein